MGMPTNETYPHIHTLPLHDALPFTQGVRLRSPGASLAGRPFFRAIAGAPRLLDRGPEILAAADAARDRIARLDVADVPVGAVAHAADRRLGGADAARNLTVAQPIGRAACRERGLQYV